MPDSEPGSEKETITIHELLKRSANSALDLQRADGSFPAGRNYTYDEPETPVRTTSRWAITISEAYQITDEERYREAAELAIDYLLKDKLRPHGYTYYCRNTSGKDKCNGLVGQATLIRGLIHAGKILDRDDAIVTAKEIFKIHPFDEDLGIWKRVEIDGEILSYDRTLNHQIIFAESIAKLPEEDSIIDNQLDIFLYKLKENMGIDDTGLIKHYIRPRLSDVLVHKGVGKDSWTLLWNELASNYYNITNRMQVKEIGYQPINLRSLGTLRKTHRNHPIWSIDKINKALTFSKGSEVQDKMYEITPGATNPGLLLGNSYYNFNHGSEEAIKNIIEENLNKYLDRSSYLLTSNSISSIDQSASISALVDLPNLEFTIQN